MYEKRRPPKPRGGPAQFEVYSETYGEVEATVGAGRLRPRLVPAHVASGLALRLGVERWCISNRLVLVHGREWLALAPFGFKCAVGAEEHVFSRAEAEAEAAADKAATADRQDEVSPAPAPG